MSENSQFKLAEVSGEKNFAGLTFEDTAEGDSMGDEIAIVVCGRNQKMQISVTILVKFHLKAKF
jgi:hypothetical protein